MPFPPLAGLPDPNGADCVDCGRCCHHEPHTVQLHEDDELRMGEERLVHLTVLYEKPPGFRFMANRGDRCIGLEGAPEGKYPCSLYEWRPTGCRTVEPGSPCCLEARRLGHLGSSVEFFRLPSKPL